MGIYKLFPTHGTFSSTATVGLTKFLKDNTALSTFLDDNFERLGLKRALGVPKSSNIFKSAFNDTWTWNKRTDNNTSQAEQGNATNHDSFTSDANEHSLLCHQPYWLALVPRPPIGNQSPTDIDKFTGNTENTPIAGNDESDPLTSLVASDPVLDWNTTALKAIQTDKTAPPLAACHLAMVHTAVYDAVNALARTHSVYQVDVPAPEGASPEAAAAAAAHSMLVNLYPQQQETFDAALEKSLAAIPDGMAEDDGVALGQQVADSILTWRSTDGRSTPIDYASGTQPGDWQPTSPAYQSALLPQWPDVTCFAMTDGAQFRPDGPPALDSIQYAADFNSVKELGKSDSLIRTPEQTEIARFWADGAGTYTPPGHWNSIAAEVSQQQGNTLEENARLFALLNIGLADAGIVAWDAKYEYDLWRPITAIQQADSDGNPETIADPEWTPLLTTPPFPEYTSGHSTFSGAADAILTNFFGDDISFTSTSIGLPGVERSFGSFSAAADEAGMSRIYGGIHFYSANEDGLATGRALGEYVFQNFLV